jgi:hypothetical protein
MSLPFTETHGNLNHKVGGWINQFVGISVKGLGP